MYIIITNKALSYAMHFQVYKNYIIHHLYKRAGTLGMTQYMIDAYYTIIAVTDLLQCAGLCLCTEIQCT